MATSFGGAAREGISRHRPGRHKKFHVRSEAMGLGYARFPALFQPYSRRVATYNPPAVVSDDEVVLEPDAQPEGAPSANPATRGMWVCLILLAFIFVLSSMNYSPRLSREELRDKVVRRQQEIDLFWADKKYFIYMAFNGLAVMGVVGLGLWCAHRDVTHSAGTSSRSS